MKITKISYGQIRNTGNYENAKADIEVTINEGDNVEEAIYMAKQAVKKALYPEGIKKKDNATYSAPTFD